MTADDETVFLAGLKDVGFNFFLVFLARQATSREMLKNAEIRGFMIGAPQFKLSTLIEKAYKGKTKEKDELSAERMSKM